MKLSRILLPTFLLVLAAASYLFPSAPISADTGNPSYQGVLFTANMEDGTLKEWYAPNTHKGCSHGICNGGGEFDSGCASIAASQDHAYRSRWSAKFWIMTDTERKKYRCGQVRESSGGRMMRWLEANKYPELYYKFMVYFPTTYQVGGFFLLQQWKSGGDPIWGLDVSNRPNQGNMYVRLGFDGKIPGPHRGEHGQQFFEQTIADLLPGRWIKIVAHIRQSSNYGGVLQVWQDGRLILSEAGINTEYPNSTDMWGVDLYAMGMTPNPAVMYIDDAVISTQPLY